mmetsp:Transcript_8283/g.22804  ORF Transcript_8283/g.22804 Transcript_8283/m.22804 type:complete len:297 (+) Transcript_8283:870-1760(+)
MRSRRRAPWTARRISPRPWRSGHSRPKPPSCSASERARRMTQRCPHPRLQRTPGTKGTGPVPRRTGAGGVPCRPRGARLRRSATWCRWRRWACSPGRPLRSLLYLQAPRTALRCSRARASCTSSGPQKTLSLRTRSPSARTPALASHPWSPACAPRVPLSSRARPSPKASSSPRPRSSSGSSRQRIRSRQRSGCPPSLRTARRLTPSRPCRAPRCRLRAPTGSRRALAMGYLAPAERNAPSAHLRRPSPLSRSPAARTQPRPTQRARGSPKQLHRRRERRRPRPRPPTARALLGNL